MLLLLGRKLLLCGEVLVGLQLLGGEDWLELGLWLRCGLVECELGWSDFFDSDWGRENGIGKLD